jgi:hypothetical protein
MMAFWKTRKVGPEGPEVSGGSGAGTGCWVGCADGEAILRCTVRSVVKYAIAIAILKVRAQEQRSQEHRMIDESRVLG